MKLTTLLAALTGTAIACFSNTSVLATPTTPTTPTLTESQLGPSYQTVTRNTATQTSLNISVYPGRATVIDFSQTSETIAFIMLADPSQVVFNTDNPMKTGTAKTILLRPIQPLEFPQSTKSEITNLVVKTISDNGKQQLYNFNIIHNRGYPEDLGIYVVDRLPEPETDNTQEKQFTFKIRGGRTATIQDIEIGLRLAINQNYTDANDPTVFQVKEFLALIRNFDLSLQEALDRSGASLVVLTELAQIAIEDYFNFPTLSLPQPENNSHYLNP
jgi:hypothetical protein